MIASGLGKRILIADDELGFRDFFRFALEPLGYAVVTVEDGYAALELLQQQDFDLVVLDVHMPRMGGPEALVKIRELRSEQRVIVLSSSSDPTHSFESRAAESGASACLFKPIDLDELLQTIEQALGDAPRAGGNA